MGGTLGVTAGSCRFCVVPGGGLGVSTSIGSSGGIFPTPYSAAAERPAIAVPGGISQRATAMHRCRWLTVISASA
ncbi:hypothetical protein [Micromonospora harpali]|uniref:hypothetical protein n=1 Tax=Micromonospora harpali TaxID=1490225 RepID=UPI00366BCC74